MTVFENVLVAKHMRARQNVFSATFRGNAKEEKRMRDESMALLAEQGLEQYHDDIATSLPYGTSAGSRSPARWRPMRSCCCSTSRRPA